MNWKVKERKPLIDDRAKEATALGNENQAWLSGALDISNVKSASNRAG